MPRNKSKKSKKTFSKMNIQWGDDELQLPAFAMPMYVKYAMSCMKYNLKFHHL